MIIFKALAVAEGPMGGGHSPEALAWGEAGEEDAAANEMERSFP